MSEIEAASSTAPSVSDIAPAEAPVGVEVPVAHEVAAATPEPEPAAHESEVDAPEEPHAHEVVPAIESAASVETGADTTVPSEASAPVETAAAPEGATSAPDVEHVPEPLASEAGASPAPQTSPGASVTPDDDATHAGDPKGPRAPRTVGFDRSVEERKQRAEEHWLHVSGSRDKGEVFQGLVTATVKGGLLVDVGGVRGFLPASQTRLETGAALESLVKTRVPVVVIDVDAKRRRIVVSQRRALEDARRAKRTELLRSLKIGQLHEGLVVRLAPFGAFVDIGGIEGLVPMSELAFERVERVEDVLKVGERLQVAVLRLDESGKKIALSRKNALPDPLRDHAALLKPGNVIEGKVVGKDTRLEVEIAPGVTGSVKESDADPAQYEIGEMVEVSVRYVDRRTRRIVLTTLHGAAAEAVSTKSTGFASLGEELLRRKK